MADGMRNDALDERLRVADDKNHALIAAPAPGIAPPREVAWVIEADLPEGLAYWTGRKGFAPFHTEAVRFSRRVDAIEVMATLRNAGNYRVAEHVWLSGISQEAPK